MRLSVLVVDDCEVVAASVARVLERAGFDVWVAHSCDDARRVAATGNFLVSVLDVQLGDGDGLQLAEWLLREGCVREVVFHSGSPLSDQEREGVGRLGSIVAKGASSKALLNSVIDAGRKELNRQLAVLDEIQGASTALSRQRSTGAAGQIPTQRAPRRASRLPRP